MYDILELNKKLLPELKEIAKELKIKRADSLRKQDLIYKILDQQAVLAIESKKGDKKPQAEAPFAGEGKRRGRRPRRPEAQKVENQKTEPQSTEVQKTEVQKPEVQKPEVQKPENGCLELKSTTFG